MRMDIINECVIELVNTRDFCGNEVERLKELTKEYRLTKDEQMEICKRTNIQWNVSRRKAGVKKWI